MHCFSHPWLTKFSGLQQQHVLFGSFWGSGTQVCFPTQPLTGVGWRPPSVLCQVGISNMAAYFYNACKARGQEEKSSARRKSRSFVTSSQKGQPIAFSVLYSLEASHQVQPTIKGEYQAMGIPIPPLKATCDRYIGLILPHILIDWRWLSRSFLTDAYLMNSCLRPWANNSWSLG